MRSRAEGIPDIRFVQCQDIPDSGSHAGEGDGFDEGASEAHAPMGQAMESRRGATHPSRSCAQSSGSVGRSATCGCADIGRPATTCRDERTTSTAARTSRGKCRSRWRTALVAARELHPTWGPRKLRAWSRHYRPQLKLPAQSTSGEVLRRRGLILQRRHRASDQGLGGAACAGIGPQHDVVCRLQGERSHAGWPASVIR